MEYSIESMIKRKVLSRINIFQRCAFVAAMIAGMICHGYILFNKISYLDDCTFYFDVGETYASGRWGLGILKDFFDYIGLQTYSMPLWNGLISILFIAFIALLLVDLLNIQNKIYAILIGLLMVAFPTVTSTFAYMFTAPYYFFSAVCMMSAVCLAVKTKKGVIVTPLFIAFGMGIYQAYFGLATATFIMVLLKEIPNKSFVDNLKNAIKYFMILLIGILLYFLLNKICLNIMNTVLGEYQGISGMGSMNISDIATGIAEAYKVPIRLLMEDYVGISNGNIIRGLYLMNTILGIVLLAWVFIRTCKKGDIWNSIFFAVISMLIPLSLAVICVMTCSEGAHIHTLMIYDFVLIMVYPLTFLTMLTAGELKVEKKKAIGILHSLVFTVVGGIVIHYMWLANAAYLKADNQLENAYAYYTVLLSHIKGIEGYDDELPVVFVGNLDGVDESIASVPEFDNITLQGYDTNLNTFIAYYAKHLFMERHCGYRYYTVENALEIKQSDYVKEMPCYPVEGAIQIVDDVIIVKFSNEN